MAKDKPKKPEPEPARKPERKDEHLYYGAAERAGLRFFDAAPEAPPTEKEETHAS